MEAHPTPFPANPLYNGAALGLQLASAQSAMVCQMTITAVGASAKVQLLQANFKRYMVMFGCDNATGVDIRPILPFPALGPWLVNGNSLPLIFWWSAHGALTQQPWFAIGNSAGSSNVTIVEGLVIP